MPFHFPDPLYPIVDVVPGRDALGLAAAILAGGAKFIQLRAKELPSGEFATLARTVKALTDAAGAQLIINDRADVARLCDAAGVHLGQDDLPPAAARMQLGPDRRIGFSTHNLEQVDTALRADAIDYLAFGPILATPSKRNADPVQGLAALRAVRARCPLPLVAIGGIDASTIAEVLGAGADAVAVIGAIAATPDPQRATRELLAVAREAIARRPTARADSTARRSPPRS
jgi:thiamine-phosphate pyrophosphorylase